jgi:hypothetical protein
MFERRRGIYFGVRVILMQLINYVLLALPSNLWFPNLQARTTKYLYHSHIFYPFVRSIFRFPLLYLTVLSFLTIVRFTTLQ